jgi:hypothetical protein
MAPTAPMDGPCGMSLSSLTAVNLHLGVPHLIWMVCWLSKKRRTLRVEISPGEAVKVVYRGEYG